MECLRIACVSVCVFPEQFLSDGDISVNIGVTAAPVITANYIESYHKVHSMTLYKVYIGYPVKTLKI